MRGAGPARGNLTVRVTLTAWHRGVGSDTGGAAGRGGVARERGIT